MANTNASGSGLTTSEGKIAAISTLLSILAAVIPGLISVFSDLAARYPDWGWIATVVTVLGIAGSVLTAIGYSKARSDVKVALIETSGK
jgi:uncharacterized membrane protein